MVRHIGEFPSGMSSGRGEGLHRLEGGPGRRSETLEILHGTLVEGTVMAVEGDEIYRIQVGGRPLTARSTVPLALGQRFRAVWDASGEVPLLRLQESELALLGKVSPQDRELASALLSRGLPLSKDVLGSLRSVWLRLGGGSDRIGPLVELWARHLPLSEEHIRALIWHAGLGDGEIHELWRRLRQQIRSQDASWAGTIRERMGDDEELRRFATATGLLSTPSREGIDPALLAPVRWPLDEREPLPARVSAQVEDTQHGKVYRVAFEMEGQALGLVSGEITSDGVQLAVTLRPEEPMMTVPLRRRLPELEADLSTGPLRLVRVGVAGRRSGRSPGRYHRVDLEA